MTGKRYFELVDEKSRKFWEIWIDGSRVVTRYGKIGTSGQTTEKDEGADAKALSRCTSLIREKVGKGYVEKKSPTRAPLTSAPPTAPNKRLAKAISSITRWMIEHDAPLLAENLAEGASTADLAKAEAAFGFQLPLDLRALWALHNGQKEEMNGFVESLDFFDTRRALNEQETVNMFVEFLRECPNDWSEAGVTRREIQSNHWVPFAGRDSDLIIVSGVSGRVFTCGKNSPPLQFVAESVSLWAEQYAARVVADDYSIEEGFGDYHLSLRDREGDHRERARVRKLQQDARYRRETPLLTQLRDALSRNDASRSQEVFERAVKKSPAIFAQSVALLFSTKRDPELIATALQLVLNVVTLTPDQWSTVAKGGVQMGNNAIRDIATARRRQAAVPVSKPK